MATLPAARARDLMTAPPGPLLILGGLGAILFGIGLDSKRWKWLGRERGSLFWAAPLQTVLTALISAAVGLLLKLPLAGAVLLGLCIARRVIPRSPIDV